MLNHIGTEQRVYLACGVTDMRKSIDGLAALVQTQFQLDPFSQCVFVFCNRQRDKLKILYWQYNGFWLLYRRLERGRFEWPSSSQDKTLVISQRQLNWLLDGLSLNQQKAHPKVAAQKVV
ncbi:IS66 family insertion sequence element accessory protein TnpB [Alicyclobacillus dauci]|uniref:IS66 family insertion sequence element accessory protein TnpB n=1 Tax=Alicyclobacillus dauci TaxID=1475485 RepID=A0ABY6YZD4_9BACL|nr:IS66 family insertion sequence element accessory protein TnpB [Alicyclobacillus dauci]WAH35668.1 IS66 family insertion sequence element accessory protein TnpB [Alicyclobacillus dauci]